MYHNVHAVVMTHKMGKELYIICYENAVGHQRKLFVSSSHCT